MQFLRWVIGGLIGGGIGAAVWITIGYLTASGAGWIAWGVGFLVGAGVWIGAGKKGRGLKPGLTAAAIAIGSVVSMKFVVALLANDTPVTVGSFHLKDESVLIAKRAGELVNKNEPVSMTRKIDSENVSVEQTYPKEIWAEAKAEWDALTKEQREQEIKDFEQQMEESFNELAKSAWGPVFRDSFSLFDALWFGLAASTALIVGAGGSGSDE